MLLASSRQSLGIQLNIQPLEKGRATHCSILAWKIPQGEEPGGLQLQCHKESHTTDQTTTEHLTVHRATSTIENCCCYYLVSKSCPTLCDPMDCGRPGSSVHGISQVSIWSKLPFSSTGDLPNPGIKPMSPALAGRFFITERPGKHNRELPATK